MWSCTVSDKFPTVLEQLHDARVFGFFFDSQISTFTFNFYVYLQIFGDFQNGRYELRKALLKFDDAKIISLSIKNDLSQGQFFIENICCEADVSGAQRFDFVFSSNEIKLNLLASNIKFIVSEEIQYSSDQYLHTDWHSLFKK
jgi:hypothetical protein